jgi:hypothetical protein
MVTDRIGVRHRTVEDLVIQVNSNMAAVVVVTLRNKIRMRRLSKL